VFVLLPIYLLYDAQKSDRLYIEALMNTLNQKQNSDNARKRQAKAYGMMLSISARLWELFSLNLLFIIFCIPVVTVPASLSALSKTLLNIVRGKDAGIWSEFRTEFKTDFFKSLLAGLVMGALGAALGLIGYAVMSFGGFIGALGVAWLIVLGSLWYFAGCYLFALIALVDITPAQCLRNALLLSLIELKHNLLLLFPLGLMVAVVLLVAVSLPLLLIMFALCQYLVCVVVIKPIQKRIIKQS
jgi:uncharacterized membrane protein YesL